MRKLNRNREYSFGRIPNAHYWKLPTGHSMSRGKYKVLGDGSGTCGAFENDAPPDCDLLRVRNRRRHPGGRLRGAAIAIVPCGFDHAGLK